MRSKWTKMATTLVLVALLGSVIAVSVPQDVSEEFLQRLQMVIDQVRPGLKLGLYYFASEPVGLENGAQAFLTLQQSTPRNALANLEKGFPIARFSAENDILISGVTIPAGDYYLILWISDKRFDRFGISFPPRVPLLLFVAEQGFELVDFAIPCKVEVEVPNKNPDKIFPLTMAPAPPDTCKPKSTAAGLVSTVVPPQVEAEPIVPWSIGIWGIGNIFWTPGVPLWSPSDPISIPPAEELFPPQEGPEQPPEEPPV